MTSVADQISGPPLAAEAGVVAREALLAQPDAPAIARPVAAERELRLDLFRGLALWLIFIDHLPQNLLTWLTIPNYGFSNATKIFLSRHPFEKPPLTEEKGIFDFFKKPDVTIVQALLLRFRPVNMDVLPLYIVLMLFLPLILWLMKWKAAVPRAR